MAKDRIVAIGLLTDDDLSRLGDAFTRLWPVDETSAGFEELLQAIDEAEAQFADSKEDASGECRTPRPLGLSGRAIRD